MHIYACTHEVLVVYHSLALDSCRGVVFNGLFVPVRGLG